MDLDLRRRPRRAVLAGLTAVLLLGTAACGGGDSGGGGSSEGLPETITVTSINPTTGVVAFAGNAANKGYELAVKEINESDTLEGSQLELELVDTRSEPQTAAQEATTAIADTDVAAVFGSVSSNEAIAMSPLLQQRGLPVIYTQAGSDGVVVGDYTWRATPLMSSYYPILSKYIEDQGFTSLGVLYTSATPTLQEVGSETVPQMAEDLGIDITASIDIPATTQDYSAPISQVLDSQPDAVVALLVGAANVTVMQQLRQAGYTGPVLGNSGASAGNLLPAGADGADMIWPVDFNFQQTAQSSQDFVEAYRAEYGEDPLNYAAEAYDAAWFLARSIAAAGSADREAIKDAMVSEAESTFDGALGEGLSWEDGTIVVPGVVVRWTGDGEELLYEGSGGA
ncbi:ABC transporter substrate-binding protein [Geodermatophilus aquaeductus]|uniref:Amino acid/amide ABC transporter substrate-binding protein, HAAT family n=1 Tax=Geodermatophilus aquaeductus TaxID=1564161 RepID=A0A521FG20_9ACTN|nr:ABC transporter substrate-binding protein [Geodermatophilus aquaeductus]SMO94601.1 amino acid/amide ABC transporter substrate-binding protein, HAAT family [Geodermatophilus aquaeductus]